MMLEQSGGTMPQTERSRIAGLDGIRAIAVVAVIAAHAHTFWLHGGGVGVDIFFVLSGYLITMLLLAEHKRSGRISLRRFWGRRVLRLVPALVLLLLVVNTVVIVQPYRFGPAGETGLAATPSILLFFSNWLIVFQNGPALGTFGPLWSLAVEDQFYLLWPLVVVWAFSRKRVLRTLAFTIGAVCAFVFVYRLVVFRPSELLRTFGTDFRVDMLLIGCLLAIAFAGGWRDRLARISRWAVWPAVAYLVAVALFTPEFNRQDVGTVVYLYYTIGIPLVGLSTALLIAYVVTRQRSGLTRVLDVPPLRYIGRISYGMYLWHYPIILALQIKFAPDPTLTFLVSLVLTLVVATASWYIVERPLSRRFHGRFARQDRSLTPVDGTA